MLGKKIIDRAHVMQCENMFDSPCIFLTVREYQNYRTPPTPQQDGTDVVARANRIPPNRLHNITRVHRMLIGDAKNLELPHK